ncbi:hypothetical protein IAU59_007023 [Kwoniella sp. CBS 9459]
MFPSSRRSRQTASARAYQKESPPTPDSRRRGDDSSYGVQSVSSWGGNSQIDDDGDDSGSMEDVNDPELQGHGIHRSRSADHAGTVDSRRDGEDASACTDEQEDQVDGSDEARGLGLSLELQHRSQADHGAYQPELHSQHERVAPADPNHGYRRDTSPVSGRVTRPAHVQSWITPPSPEDTVHPLERSSSAAAAGGAATQREPPSPGSQPRLDHLTLDSLNSARWTPGSPFLPTSEPSSPASFTSMPSYVASLSSLSRTSSLSPFGLDHDQDQEHNHDHDRDDQHRYGALHPSALMGGGSDELVLPTLALPSESLSLHLSLPRWSGPEESGLRVVLLGEREIVEKTLRGVRERCEMVELKGGVGLVKEGKVVVRISTAFRSLEQVQANVTHSYRSLNRLIHPDLQGDKEEEGQTQVELRRLVEGYAARSDWVHMVISLSSEGDEEGLDSLVPTTRINLPDPIEISQASVEQLPDSRLAEIEPTPRPCDEPVGSGYFAPRPYTPSPTASRDSSPSRLRHSPEGVEGIDQAIGVIYRINSNPSLAIRRSIESFLAWRAVQPQVNVKHHAEEQGVSLANTGMPSGQRTMTSSMTSASSSYGTGGPMPTVARAQGGGEWEATLSRRVAQRRESVLVRDRDRARASPTFQSRHAYKGSGLAPLPAAGATPASGGSGVRGRGGVGRRRSMERLDRLDRRDSKEKSCLPPLFPTSPTPIPTSSAKAKAAASGPVSSSPSRKKPSGHLSEPGLGIHALLEKTFSGVRHWTKGWRGFVVVAVLVAVGWGCYASAK